MDTEKIMEELMSLQLQTHKEQKGVEDIWYSEVALKWALDTLPKCTTCNFLFENGEKLKTNLHFIRRALLKTAMLVSDECLPLIDERSLFKMKEYGKCLSMQRLLEIVHKYDLRDLIKLRRFLNESTSIIRGYDLLESCEAFVLIKKDDEYIIFFSHFMDRENNMCSCSHCTSDHEPSNLEEEINTINNIHNTPIYGDTLDEVISNFLKDIAKSDELKTFYATKEKVREYSYLLIPFITDDYVKLRFIATFNYTEEDRDFYVINY